MNNYQKGKEKARQEAIKWQADFCNHNYDMVECLRWLWYFEKLAKRYGLSAEFKENGII